MKTQFSVPAFIAMALSPLAAQNARFEPTLSSIPATLTHATSQTISITMRNTGTGTLGNWTSSFGFYHLKRVSAQNWLPLFIGLPTNVEIPLNGTYTFQFQVSPPQSASGTTGLAHTVTYRMGVSFYPTYDPVGLFGQTVNFSVNVQPLPSAPGTTNNLVKQNTWSHAGVAGDFTVYDYPIRRVDRIVPYLPWISTYPYSSQYWAKPDCAAPPDGYQSLPTAQCGERIATTYSWDEWSRNYIPDYLQGTSHDGITDPDVGWRIRIFSNHNVIPVYSGDPPKIVAGKLSAPIIISQGFDPNYGTPGQFNYDQFGGQLIDEFESARTTDPVTGKLTFKRITSSTTNLLRASYNGDYEIVLVTFKDPNAKIEDNSRAIQAVLMQIHATGWLDNPDQILLYSDRPIKIIGPSMGGLVCRHAIQTFQSRVDVGGNRPPNITNFVAFDTPNRGAVIPLSLQAFADYFHTENADVGKIYENLTGPVAQEMLLYQPKMGRLSTDNSTGRTINYHTIQITDYEDNSGGYGTEHGRFMTDINSVAMDQEIYDYPSPALNLNRHIRMTAIANGSGIGESHGFTPAAYIGDARLRTWLFFPGTSIIIPGSTRETDWYLFASAVSGTATSVFSGGGSVNSPLLLQYNFNEPVFTENLPGSGRPTYRIINDLWDNADAYIGSNADTWWPYWNGIFSDNSHAFVPTLSALGLVSTFGADWDVNRLPDWFSSFRNNIASLESTSPRQSLFNHLYVPEHNQDHVMLTPENKNWLLYELNAAYNAPSGR